MKTARSMAPFATDGVVGRLAAGSISYRAANRRVTFQALIGAVNPVECFPQKLVGVLRVRRLIQKGEVTSSRVLPLRVQIALADDDDFSLSGVVVFTDNQIDPGTGTLRARATIHNPKLNTAPWYLLSPGQFVRVRVPIGTPRDAVLVPERAIGSDQGQRFVYVVTADKTVQRRDVRVGQQYGSSRVIEDNVVTPSDRIIVDGLLRVRQGLEVNAKELEPPKPKPPTKPAAPAPEAPAPHEKTK